MTTHLSPAALGRWSARHPWLAVACWLAFVMAALGLLVLTGSKSLSNGTTGESGRAEAMFRQVGARPDQTQFVYLHSDTLHATDPAFHSAIARVASRVSGTLGSRTTLSYAAGGHSALVSAPIQRPFDDNVLRAGVTSAVPQQVSATVYGINTNSKNTDLRRAERLSVPVTLFVLLLAFGALVASIIPVILGATAVVAAFGLLGPISHVFPLDSSVKTVVLLIGMAVGVDYALFYVIRSREERARGVSSHEALERTARTSGHTVIVAGTTVAVAMAGQFMMRSDIFNGIAVGTIAVVACAVAGSVTVLPAVLELLGPRIDRGHIPFLPHLGSGEESRFWSAAVDRVLRRPLVWCVAALAVLIGLAVPALNLHVSQPDNDVLSPTVPLSQQAKIDAAFPQTSAPAILVFSWPRSEQGAGERALTKLERLAVAQGIAHPPLSANLAHDGHAATLALPLSGLPDSNAAKHALSVLRNTSIPETLGHVAGATFAVTGETARDVDSTRHLIGGLPYVIAFVLALAFLILLVTFRSIVIPIKAIVLNLLSVGASYGVLVLVFQHHWAEGVLGFHSMGSLIAWLPVFLFVVLFGLSMDYHVFILSRVREGIDGGMSNDEALRAGIARTAGVVTSAAIVMFGVFSLFATSSSLDLKEAGIGLGVAVLIDATIVRGVLLPASMKLLGDWNWYLPPWLDWVPRLREDRLPALPAPATD
jgi:RND superfamily putative drug exporter